MAVKKAFKCPENGGEGRNMAREASEHRTVFVATGQRMLLVSDVRLDIPCSILDIEIAPDGNTLSDIL